jgi:methylated-DNA-protein-cysteine methyltransferase-like protein
MMTNTTYSRIYKVIKSIPFGKVATYGQIARIAGLPGQARQVGYALNSSSAVDDIPWHRVINAQGKISSRNDETFELIQRRLLEDEGIIFGEMGRINFEQYQWLYPNHIKKS